MAKPGLGADVDVETILVEYDSRRRLFKALGHKVNMLIDDLLRDNDLRVHSVTHRVKDRRSLERKLRGSMSKYLALDDVTDILGVRIITYFPDEVDKVADVIKQEFSVDGSKSHDRRATIEPTSFGYISLHYIVALSSARAALTEYRQFQKYTFEIQVRSILQHAWAEIEHDLGYKTEQAVPRLIQRRFARLAGLLELADEQFRQIRDERQHYRAEVGAAIQNEPTSVFVDRESVFAFIRDNALVNDIDRRIAEVTGGVISEGGLADLPARLSASFQLLGLGTIADVEDQLTRHQERIVDFAARWYTGDHAGLRRFLHGISLVNLSYILAMSKYDEDGLKRFLREIDPYTASFEEMAKGLQSTLQQLLD
jgi:putative GTP pyrophosphokinase